MSFKRILMILLLPFLLLGCIPDGEQEKLDQISLYLAKGENESALSLAEEIVDQNPQSYEGWNQIGWSHLRMGEVQKAKQAFQASIDVEPQWDNAYVGMAACLVRQEDYERARWNYEKALELFPENGYAYSSLVALEIREGNYDAAVEAGEKAMALLSDDGTVAANLSLAYHFAGDAIKAHLYMVMAEELDYYSMQTLREILQDE